jgi:hydroxymethylglutaryl-CoA reductase (NADPH)
MSNNKIEYKNVPGRGLMCESAYKQRIEFFKSLVKDSEIITSTNISLEQVQNNIESFIGSVELPLGLAGPLLFNSEENQQELVYTGICTTEGALVASMNRGAKAISECGGFSAHFVHQKMLRSPLFTFKNMAHTVEFEKWLKNNFESIKTQTSLYSNHAELIEIKSLIIGKLAHLKFIYTTCDASGQNMVTYCTWHALLYINEHFQKETDIDIIDFYIDGNGSSDKKVSYYSLQNGRGVHVVCECFLSDEIIEKILRTNSADMFRLANHSMAISRFDGIIGGTLNIANAIAGIFAATGQDLGSIHESSLGILQVDKTDEGLYLSLSIPALVIGTIGGGTHLPVAKTMLELMNCYGTGKVERFAKLIAGFALSLEISTLAALASGQFARAHQKMGKNKVINWLLKSDIDTRFIKKYINEIQGKEIKSVELLNSDNIRNGILTDLASRVSKKIIGFIPLSIYTDNGEPKKILLKSKPLDDELMKGLHFMASTINVDLADNLLKYKDHLEYSNSHVKEVDVYKFLNSIEYPFMPDFFGEIKDKSREIYLFLFEYLDEEYMELFNSENNTDKWTDILVIDAIQSIHIVHKAFLNGSEKEPLNYIREFDPVFIIPLYLQLNRINQKDYADWNLNHLFDEIGDVITIWKSNPPLKKSVKTLVHNDFNTRNVGIRKNGKICIYDWELAMLNIPQRDIFEFLAFTLDPDFHEDRLLKLVTKHFELLKEINISSYNWKEYLDDFIISGYEFLITRASFYLAGSTLVDYRFIKRVFICSNRIIQKAKNLYGPI